MKSVMKKVITRATPGKSLVSNIFGSKFGIYLENSSSKLNFRQIHLVYLPKPGPISKPALMKRLEKPPCPEQLLLIAIFVK